MPFRISEPSSRELVFVVEPDRTGLCVNEIAMFQQCLLQNENAVLTSFLPLKFAVVGMLLRLKNSDGVWEDGWIVKRKFSRVEAAPDPRRSFRQHEQSTGDSLRRSQSQL